MTPWTTRRSGLDVTDQGWTSRTNALHRRKKGRGTKCPCGFSTWIVCLPWHDEGREILGRTSVLAELDVQRQDSRKMDALPFVSPTEHLGPQWFYDWLWQDTKLLKCSILQQKISNYKLYKSNSLSIKQDRHTVGTAAFTTYESIQVSQKKNKNEEGCLRHLQGGEVLFIWLSLSHINCLLFIFASRVKSLFSSSGVSNNRSLKDTLEVMISPLLLLMLKPESQLPMRFKGKDLRSLNYFKHLARQGEAMHNEEGLDWQLASALPSQVLLSDEEQLFLPDKMLSLSGEHLRFTEGLWETNSFWLRGLILSEEMFKTPLEIQIEKETQVLRPGEVLPGTFLQPLSQLPLRQSTWGRRSKQVLLYFQRTD